MIETRKGTIRNEIFARPGIKGFTVQIGERLEKCIAYTNLVGDIKPGDEVLLNTTAVALKLGSGGFHYIITALNPGQQNLTPGGHIMKLRYTPLQLKVLSVEEEDGPFHEEMAQADNLQKTPVLVATLHSMLAPICLEFAAQGLRAAYVMTDGAALPLAFSKTVDWLKKHEFLVGTVTTGHAFGGDLEAVNVYSGLLAAQKILKAQVIIVSMGPGIVGTGTKWGFSGIEQGDILNAVDSLQGIPVAVPRVSFADPRPRHQGISHHSLTVLSRVCRVPAILPLPWLEEEKSSFILEQIRKVGIADRYRLCMEDSRTTLQLCRDCELSITTMGRGIDQDKEFFMAAGAAAVAAGRLARGEQPHYLQLA